MTPEEYARLACSKLNVAEDGWTYHMLVELFRQAMNQEAK